MTKLKKRILIAAIAALLSACVLMFSACRKDPPVDSFGGDSTQRPPVEYTISAPDRFHLRSGQSGYDFASAIQVSDAEGNLYQPTLDTSDISFGSKGEYLLKCAYGDQTLEIPVFVYTMPEVDVVSDTLSLSYYQALSDLFSGITAADCFGQELPVMTIDDGGMYHADGSVRYGSFDVVCGAMDAAGNLASRTLAVTVRDEGNNPGLPAAASVDCTEELLTFACDADIVGISVEGRLLEQSEYAQVRGTVEIPCKAIVDSFGLGQKIVRVITESGYSEMPLTVTDLHEPQISVYGLNGWVYRVGEKATLPQVKRLNANQQYVLRYSMTAPSGKSVTVANGQFLPEEEGDYLYRTTAVKTDGSSYDYVLTVSALSGENYDRVIDRAVSGQFLASRFSVPVNNESAFSFDYFEQEVTGQKGCYRMNTGTTGNWYNRIEISADYIANSKIADYDYLCVDVCFTQVTELHAWINAAAVALSAGTGLKLYDAAGNAVAYESLGRHLNEWLTLKIDISGYSLTSGTQRLAIGPTAKNTVLYFKNFVFE